MSGAPQSPRDWPTKLWVPRGRATCSGGRHPVEGGSIIVRSGQVEHFGCRWGDGEPEDRVEAMPS